MQAESTIVPGIIYIFGRIVNTVNYTEGKGQNYGLLSDFVTS